MTKANSPQSTSYQFKYDFIRAIAIICVVAIHVFYPVYGRWDFLGGISWWFANLVNTFSRIGVPLFILVSGYFNLSKTIDEPPKTIFIKVMKRIGFPLIIWYLIYLWGETYFLQKSFSLKDVYAIFLSGSVFNLYFLVILFWLYLFIPLFKKGFAQNSIIFQKYLLIITFIFSISAGLIQYFFYKDTPLFFILTLWLPYLFYFLGGYYFSVNKQVASTKSLTIVYFFTFILTALAFYLELSQRAQGILFFWKDGGLDYWGDYLSPNVIIMAVTFFLIILKSNAKLICHPNPYFQKVIWNLARCAFGIYLIHPLVIGFLDANLGFNISLITGNLWIYLIQKFLLVMIISFFLSYLIRHLPYIKAIVGE